MSKIDTLNISFTDRNARRRGPTSSEAWNDCFDEIASDLAGLYSQWNTRLKTLTDTLPDGTINTSVDAFVNGLDGKSLYVDSDSTVTDTPYYNTGNSRPNTVYEQFAALYTYVDSINEALGNQIGGQVFSAANMTIQDNNNYFAATNVEDTLSELYTTFKNSYILSGSGSPEGVVVANMGAIYVNTAGGVATTLYVKTSGTGASGWTAK
jgi:hypothetical protein